MQVISLRRGVRFYTRWSSTPPIPFYLLLPPSHFCKDSLLPKFTLFSEYSMPLPCDLQTAFALAEDKSYRDALSMVQTVAKEFLVVVDDSSSTSTADIVMKTDTQHPLLEVLGNGNKQHW